MQHQQAPKQPPKPPEPKPIPNREAVKQPPIVPVLKQHHLEVIRQLSKGVDPRQQEAAKHSVRESEGKQTRHEEVKHLPQAAETRHKSIEPKEHSAKQIDPKQRLREEAKLLQKESDPRHHEKQEAAHMREADPRHLHGRQARAEEAAAKAAAEAAAKAAAQAAAKAAAEAAAKAQAQAAAKAAAAKALAKLQSQQQPELASAEPKQTAQVAPQPVETRNPDPTPDGTASQSASQFDRPYGLGGPQQPSTSDDNKLTKSLTDPKGAQPRKAEAGPGGRAKSFGLNLPPPAGTYAPNELVVPGLRTEVRQTLLDRGYQVKTDKDFGVARVVLPKDGGASAWELQRDLEKEFQQSFGLNFIYKAYHGATRPGEDPNPGTPTAKDYGPRLINWNKEQLKACEFGHPCRRDRHGRRKEPPRLSRHQSYRNRAPTQRRLR